MAKYVLLVATSASCFRNFQRGLGDFLLSGGEGQKQIQWGGYICEEEWGEKVEFERVSNWGKMTSFFWAFRIHLQLQMISKGSCEDWGWDGCKSKEEIDENEERGDKKNYVDKQDIWWNERTDQSFNQMISRSGKLRYEVGKTQLSINLKLSLEMNQSQKVGEQKCPVQHRLRWVQFKIFLAFIIQVLTFLQDLGFHHPYVQLLTRLTGISKSIDSIWGGKLKVVPARIRTRTDAWGAIRS